MDTTRLFRLPYALMSRLRIPFFRLMGMSIGLRCRLEKIRVRQPSQIKLGAYNSLTEGCWLWPEDEPHPGYRIVIGEYNYFNRGVMIDACGMVRIGNQNMFGPGVYITDSNHTSIPGKRVGESPMDTGEVVIGDGCWIGAGAKILKGVCLGDRCVVGDRK